MTTRWSTLDLGSVPAHFGSMVVRNKSFEAFAHRMDGKLILEFEQVTPSKETSSELYAVVRACMAELQSVRTVEHLLDTAARYVRKLTGFDRVLAYKFLGDGTGQILAEARRNDLTSFLGLHFPPGDVPAPARRILSLVWVRCQPDTAYVPVPIQSAQGSPEQLDLSYSILRSTSAMCNRYYQNLGVRAKLVVALLNKGEMWGALICQNETPKHVSYERQMACETVAHTVSILLSEKEAALEAQDATHSRQCVESLVLQMTEDSSWAVALAKGLLGCLLASGAAALVEGGTLLQGDTPAEDEVQRLVAWLEEREPQARDEAFSTHCLGSLYPEAMHYRAAACGLLAVRVGEGEYLLWFRPEQAYEVTWAGDPHKPVEIDRSTGHLSLSPRTSFEMQRSILQGLAEPWKPFEIEAATALRRALRTIRHAEGLSRSAGELKASNSELESFAYIVSHDLREPLRGIRTYSQLLSCQLGESLGAPEQARLNSIQRLATRMDDLLLYLLQCSRVGRTAPERQPADLNVALENALEMIGHRLAETGATIQKDGKLPVLSCDPVQVQEIFLNLIMNGLKYNLNPHKVIRVGCQEGPVPTLYVRDNGIGIAPEHHENVFRIYRRLHGEDEFGGGTGAGLTIVQKMVERHGGKIWIESAVGEGSTFFFTLPQ